MNEREKFRLHDKTFFWSAIFSFFVSALLWQFRIPQRGALNQSFTSDHKTGEPE
jgi:hypothetical protein